MKAQSTIEPELSRPLQVDKVSAGGVAEDIVANVQERKALAARFDLIDLPKLEATLNVDHSRGRMLLVTGTLKADIVQQCVVSLEPVADHIEDKINVLFAPPHMLDKGAGSPHFDAGEEETPEPIVNGVIDLGELVSQHLAIAMNPYPRKPGVSLETAQLSVAENETKKATNPFANLAELKKKPKK